MAVAPSSVDQLWYAAPSIAPLTDAHLITTTQSEAHLESTPLSTQIDVLTQERELPTALSSQVRCDVYATYLLLLHFKFYVWRVGA